MKKLLFSLSLSLILSIQITKSQTLPGAISVGVSAGYSGSGDNKEFTRDEQKQKTDGSSNHHYSFLPNISYFLTDRWSIGLGVGINGTKGTENYETTDYSDPSTIKYRTIKLNNSSFTWNILPFVRYFIPLSEKAYFITGLHAQAGLGNRKNQNHYLFTNNVSDIHTYTEKISTYGLALRPAFLFFPSDKWGLEFSLGNFASFNINSNKTTGSNGASNDYLNRKDLKTTTTNFSILGINSLGVGASIYYFFK